jgi:hypothetical protein
MDEADILIVDDLSHEAMLGELGENLFKAHSRL